MEETFAEAFAFIQTGKKIPGKIEELMTRTLASIEVAESKSKDNEDTEEKESDS